MVAEGTKTEESEYTSETLKTSDMFKGSESEIFLVTAKVFDKENALG